MTEQSLSMEPGLTPAAFDHHAHSAHCESGVMVTLLRHAGIEISEPMVFGLSSALNFAYLPFLKVGGQPLIAYRMPPRFIIRKLCKRLGIKLKEQKFSSEKQGLDALNAVLSTGRIAGLQTSVYWLPYFPEAMRFHFNAHNLVVYGRDGENYFISDPVFESPVCCHRDDLQKARFAKGALAARGNMYYPLSLPDNIDYPKLIKKSISATCRIVDGLPLPIVGIRGIRFLARKISKLPMTGSDDRSSKLFLGHIVRMQEEIGTGGAGFRFMYASFLQEAASITNNEVLAEASEMMTATGDLWREFAVATVKFCKGRSHVELSDLADALNTVADNEQHVIDKLRDFRKMGSAY